MRKLFSSFTLVALLMSLQACGGGDAHIIPREQKTVIVEFGTTTTNTDLNALTKAVTMVVKLPEGVAVITDPGNTTISGAVAGVNNFLVYPAPTYVAAQNEVTIYATNVTNASANVVFARLTCSVKPGYTLTDVQFSSIIPVVFELTGPGGSDLALVNPRVLPKISATFGY